MDQDRSGWGMLYYYGIGETMDDMKIPDRDKSGSGYHIQINYPNLCKG